MITSDDIITASVSYAGAIFGVIFGSFQFKSKETKRKIEIRIQKSIDEIERRKSAIRRKILQSASKKIYFTNPSGAP